MSVGFFNGPLYEDVHLSVLALQHVDVERLSLLEEVLAQQGIPARYLALHKGERLPDSVEDMEDAEAIVVLGGPMGVYEEEKHPWLADEIRFLGEAIRSGFPVYGLCLGAQLMAAALGARVYPGEGKKEIGWFPVDLTPGAQGDPLLGDEEASFPVFQWHGDTFDIPEGAVRLASSARYPNQAFRWGERAYAFQFHLETGMADISAWLEAFAGDMRSPRSDADPGAILRDAAVHLETLNKRAARWFERWLALAGLIESS